MRKISIHAVHANNHIPPLKLTNLVYPHRQQPFWFASVHCQIKSTLPCSHCSSAGVSMRTTRYRAIPKGCISGMRVTEPVRTLSGLRRRRKGT